MSEGSTRTRCDHCARPTPASQLVAYRGLCPDCAQAQHTEGAQWLRALERAESLLLTPGEAYLFFSWDRDPADTFRWRRLPTKDRELGALLASYKTMRRVIQYSARIGDALPSAPYLMECADVLARLHARRVALALQSIAKLLARSADCRSIDKSTVLPIDASSDGRTLTLRQELRNLCATCRLSDEDPLGLALIAFREHRAAWPLVDRACARHGYPQHLRQVLARRNERTNLWDPLGVLKRLRPTTAPLVANCMARVTSTRPIYTLAEALASLLIPDDDRSREASWDRAFLEFGASSAGSAMLASHFEARVPGTWVDTYREYRKEILSGELEDQGGEQIAAAVAAEIRGRGGYPPG